MIYCSITLTAPGIDKALSFEAFHARSYYSLPIMIQLRGQIQVKPQLP